MFARYRRALQPYFRTTISLDQARLRLATEAARRPQALLHLLHHAIFPFPNNPYRRLLDWAGFTPTKLERLVSTQGVESTLAALHQAGVYVTIEEFKGRTPIRRPGLEFPVRHQDFDNPVLDAHFEGRTSGSRGPRRRLLLDLSLVDRDACAHRIFLESFQLAHRPHAVWRSVPPDNSGIKKPLMHARLSLPMDRWFSPLPPRWSPAEFKYAAFTAYTVFAARRAGRSFPYPEFVPLNRAAIVARWMAQMTARGTPAFLDSSASAAVRVCAAARELNLDISGSMFRTGGEPLTAAKAQLIRDTGSRVACHFAMSEAGPVAMACADPTHTDDVHLLIEKMAAISANPSPSHQPAPLLLTTLFPHCPKIMLNVDTGDSAILEHRPCSCEFGRLGFTLHLHHIRSHEKLTSEGTLFLGADLVPLVEEVLPRAFGGTPTDYQFLEQECNGLSRVSIVIHPRLGPIDESRVLSLIYQRLSRGHSIGNALMTAHLLQGQTLSVLRREPLTTPSNKTLPLHVLPRQ
jgi:hypothetical protein